MSHGHNHCATIWTIWAYIAIYIYYIHLYQYTIYINIGGNLSFFIRRKSLEQYIDTHIYSKLLRSQMKARVMKELLQQNVFRSLINHGIDMHHPHEELNSPEVSKAIVEEYLNFWHFRHGKDVTASIKMSKIKCSGQRKAVEWERDKSNKIIGEHELRVPTCNKNV